MALRATSEDEKDIRLDHPGCGEQIEKAKRKGRPWILAEHPVV